MKNNVFIFTIRHSYFDGPWTSSSVCNTHVLRVSVSVIVHFIETSSWILVAQHKMNLWNRDSMLQCTLENLKVVDQNAINPMYNMSYNSMSILAKEALSTLLPSSAMQLIGRFNCRRISRPQTNLKNASPDPSKKKREGPCGPFPLFLLLVLCGGGKNCVYLLVKENLVAGNLAKGDLAKGNLGGAIENVFRQSRG